MSHAIYKWTPSFIYEDSFLTFGTDGTPYTHTMSASTVKSQCSRRFTLKRKLLVEAIPPHTHTHFLVIADKRHFQTVKQLSFNVIC